MHIILCCCACLDTITLPANDMYRKKRQSVGQTLFGIFLVSITIYQVITLQVNFAIIASRQASSTTFYAGLGEAML